MKCPICESSASKGELCGEHQLAYEKLKEAFEKWQNAMEINWQEYLEKIIVNDGSGKWVVEVAEHLKNKKQNQ